MTGPSATTAAAIERMTASLTNLESVQDGLLQSYRTIAQLVRNAKNDPAALDALASKIETDAQKITDAVLENTEAGGGGTGGETEGGASRSGR